MFMVLVAAAEARIVGHYVHTAPSRLGIWRALLTRLGPPSQGCALCDATPRVQWHACAHFVVCIAKLTHARAYAHVDSDVRACMHSCNKVSYASTERDVSRLVCMRVRDMYVHMRVVC